MRQSYILVLWFLYGADLFQPHTLCFVYRLMRSCKFKLEKDLKEKHGAQEIDNTCATLTDDAPGLKYSQDAVKVQTK